MDAELLELAAAQHGLLTLRQMDEAGHRNLARRRLRSGEWVTEQPGVVRPALWSPTYDGRLTAVRLSLDRVEAERGWCFSHTSAAHLRGLRLDEPTDVHVLVSPDRRESALRGVRRHLTAVPPVAGRVEGNPLPELAATVLQCAAVLSRDQLSTLVEDLLRREKMDLPALRDLLGRGRSGSARLRGVVDELESEGVDRWMRRLVRLLVADGLPQPALEHRVFIDGRLFAILDGWYEEAALDLEVDDWETHGPRAAAERDRRRDTRLFTTFGITTVRMTPRQIRERPRQIVHDVRAAYERGVASHRADHVRPSDPSPGSSRT